MPEQTESVPIPQSPIPQSKETQSKETQSLIMKILYNETLLVAVAVLLSISAVTEQNSLQENGLRGAGLPEGFGLDVPVI